MQDTTTLSAASGRRCLDVGRPRTEIVRRWRLIDLQFEIGSLFDEDCREFLVPG
jgi:hypothetical protein